MPPPSLCLAEPPMSLSLVPMAMSSTSSVRSSQRTRFILAPPSSRVRRVTFPSVPSLLLNVETGNLPTTTPSRLTVPGLWISPGVLK